MYPKEMYYTQEHEWMKKTEDGWYIGITHYAQEQLGDIVFVELPETETTVEAGQAVAVVESVKTASDIYSPMEGTVAQVNEELIDRPELLNEDPYESWIYVIKTDNAKVSDLWMSSDEYQAYIEESADE